MKFIRLILLFASIGGAIFMFHSVIVDNRSNYQVALTLGLGCALNAFYLALGGAAPDRMSKLISLWFEAKEAELRHRRRIAETLSSPREGEKG